MDIVFSEGAREEILQAYEYYEEQVSGLGEDFVDAIARAAGFVKRFPEVSRLIAYPYRRYLMPRFPYGLIYLVGEERITVLAVAHLMRKPNYWLGRDE